ncbi:MAG: tetratricopeptide repeat protein [Bacteroidetes bacterium]|nr:tetratricopeptide repeat protein [Bacteroidota bacterium]
MSESNSYANIMHELNSKAWDYRYIDRTKAMEFAIQAKENAEKYSNLIDFHFAQLTIAQLNFWKSSESTPLIIANEALTYFESVNVSLGISRANSICAGMYDQFGQYEKAMQNALNAVKASELIDDETNKSDCYTTLGQIYSRIHDYSNAITALNKGLTIRQHSKDNKAAASSLNLIARNYVLSKNYEEAKNYYNKSLTLRESIKDEDGIPWTYLGLASLYSEQENWDLSLDYYQKAEQSNLKQEKRFDVLCLLGKGKIYLYQANLTESITCLNKALTISQDLKITSIQSEVHELLAQAFEKSSDLTQALFHFKTYNQLRQEILSNDKVNTLKNQQIAFSVESAEKEAEIHRLKNVELKNAFNQIATQHHQLEEKSKEITDSITYAKRIQDAYLPEKDLLTKIFPQAFLLFKPKDIVSGDFYWYSQLSTPTPSRIFAAADCTGHGVPGAIMSVICNNALNEVVNNKHIHQPDLILNEVRNMVTASFKKQGESSQKDGMDIALVRLIDTDGKTILQFAGANNPLWIIRKGQPSSSSENIVATSTHYLIEIKADKQPIGNYEKMNPFTLHTMDLQSGDTIYSFSDGYADQFGGTFGKKMKYKPLKDLLLSIQDKEMSEQNTILYNAYNDWKRSFEQIDDVCMIGVRV